MNALDKEDSLAWSTDHPSDLYRELFCRSPEVWLCLSETGNVIDASDGARRFYGRSLVDLIGCAIDDLTTGDGPGLKPALEEAMQSGSAWSQSLQVCGGGQVCSVAVTIYRLQKPYLQHARPLLGVHVEERLRWRDKE